MKKNILFIVVLISLISFDSKAQKGDVHNLGSGWSFVYKDKIYKAKIPGNIFLDLQRNGIIDDPYFADNELRVQWVSKCKWEYISEFDLDSAYLDHQDITLNFDGLDTYAEVFLNDKKILSANNMFRKWVVPVKSMLRRKNKIKILFSPPLVIDSIHVESQSYKFPDSRAFTRKAPYQYGWDWGPKLVGVGIWKDVYLEANDGFKLKDIYIRQNYLDSSIAKLAVYVDIDNFAEDSLEINVYDSKVKKIRIHKTIGVKKDTNLLKFDFDITDPEFWWPNGMGAPYLYDLSIDIISPKQTINRKISVGLRTIRLVRHPDQSGSSFYFEVNGIPVFAKGANYVPQDNFPSRVDDNKYQKLIQDAVKSNMNMLRVWGGGIYEKDIFYDLCDKNGIMVWQDFMYACNFYPGNADFVKNAKEEAKEQIVRLRNHPSLVLWCGNNEIDEAWHNWGYQKLLKYTEKDSVEIWHNYKIFFHGLLPQLVSKYSPSISYITTSPQIGWGHDEALLSGDMHYWGVWWGAEPFEVYKKKVGRFMSEYGFQGFPDLKTIKSFVKELKFDSPALLNHQKHPRGMQLIKEYMERDFPVPERFEDYVYMSQLVQAYGMNIAIEAHRRAKPYCMGTLYWQLNDSWPVISWSSIDYYGRWKALQYQVKRDFKTVIISGDISKDRLDMYIVSDSLNDISGKMINTILSFDGEVIFRDTVEVYLPSNKSDKVASYLIKNLTSGISASKVFLSSILKSGDRILANKIVYFLKPKQLNLKYPEIDYVVKKTETGFVVEVKSNTLVKSLSLSTDIEGKFSDNYFDMLPNKVYDVYFEAADKVPGNLDIRLNFINKFVK